MTKSLKMKDNPPINSVDSSIDCDQCEACCCRLEVILLGDTGVPYRYLDENEYGHEVMARLDDGKCVALDRNTMRCTIYEQRPQVCRDFEMGSFACEEEREIWRLNLES
jgi:Fe-S-cluster containining protein